MNGSAASPRLSAWRRWLLAVALVLGIPVAAQAAVVRTFNSTDVPATIPEVVNPPGSQAGTTLSTLGVSGISGSITHLTLKFYITHSFTSDLAIFLVPPDPVTGAAGTGNGILVVQDIYSSIVANPGGTGGVISSGNNRQGGSTTSFGSGMNQQVTFDDGGNQIAPLRDDVTQINNAFANVYLKTGAYQPFTSFAANFNGKYGKAVNGIWTLRVVDRANEDSGSVRAWSLTITELGPHIWNGAQGNNFWNDVGNWEGGNKPDPTEIGAMISFPDRDQTGALITSRTPDNDFAVGAINCAQMSVAGGYTLTGNAITMRANSTFIVVDGTASDVVNWGIDLNMLGTITFTRPVGSTLNLTSVLSGAAGAPTFAGTGLATMSNGNGYGGATTVSAGILGISNNGALGTPGGNTTVASGATLRIDGAVTTTEPLVLNGTGTSGQGALSADANTVCNGAVTLSPSVTTGIGANGAAISVTLNSFAAMTGPRWLSAIGAGSVILGGALPATAVTNLLVNGGTLQATIAQPSVGSLTLNGGTITPSQPITIAGPISVSATAAGSTLSAGTINLGGGRSLTVDNGAAVNDLTVSAAFAGGSLTKHGGGTVLWNNSASAGVAMTVEAGELTGFGALGNLSIKKAKFAPLGGTFTVNNLSLSSSSWLAYTSGNPISALTASIGGGVLQPFGAGGGTVIQVTGGNAASTTGEFLFYTRTPASAVTYTATDGNDVAFAGGGSSVSFAALPASYSAKEGDGPIQLALTSSGAVNVAITSAGGQLTPGGDFVIITNQAVNGATTVPLTVNDDFISEGTESGELILIPLNGHLAAPGNATLTITDNDKDDQNTCGFGTGLTVFLLLGFALALRARLRRW